MWRNCEGNNIVSRPERSHDGEKIHLAGITTTLYNPFAASAMELVAGALEDAGLIDTDTTLNGVKARVLLNSLYEKREKYRETTRLGSLLVNQGILDQSQLKRALFRQRENGDMKLGEALLELGICSISEIERNLDAQLQIRADMDNIEGFRKKITLIKQRLRKYF